MVTASLTKPTKTASKYFSFLTSSDAYLALGVVVGTPLGLGLSNFLVSRIAFLRGNVGIALVIASIIIFAIAGAVSGMISKIFLGISLGLAINALFTVPQIAGILGRISSAGRSGQESN